MFKVLLFSAAAAIVKADSGTCGIPNSAKVDCGFAGIDQSSCEAKNCCWNPAGKNSATPWCFEKNTGARGFSLSDMKETESGFTGTLNALDNHSIKELSLQVIFETEDIARVKITDKNKNRWEVPQSIIPTDKNLASLRGSKTISNQNYNFKYTSNPFSFEITRKSDGRTIFSFDGPSFLFQDQYITFQSKIEQNAVTYGIGESTRLQQALKVDDIHTLWAADIAAANFDVNLYGSFPYYLQMIDGTAHGAMLLNSNGMDVTLKTNSIDYNVIGGIVDLFIFVGSTPSSVVSQYTSVVGRPMMMPYWSLGFHNCKYGYESVYQVEQVVANYSAAKIPLDTQWMDIDYMEAYRDFTWNQSYFPQKEVKSFVDGLHKNGQHFVPIIDPGIMVADGYDAYEQGMKKDLFIKGLDNQPYLAQVWPGPVHFPDFLNPNTEQYWINQISTFHKGVPIDGLWIDMNEVSNFCNGDGQGQVCVNTASSGCPTGNPAEQTTCCLECSLVDVSNKLDFPTEYNIHNHQNDGALSAKTLAMSTTHYGGVSTYDAHNLYGLTEQIATNTALTKIRNKRPFLVSRSSFVSTGAHSAKWTGDNAATWEDLRSSIISLMDFSIFGVPMIGADICGFIDATTEELCARWIEVGAFYPFSRDHNALGAPPQELYLWDSVAEASRNALAMRYRLLPYMYTLFYAAHTAGEMVSRALWMNFPSDQGSFGKDGQFMLGSSILVSPVLTPGDTSVMAYFPLNSLWYCFNNPSVETVIDTTKETTDGLTIKLDAPLTVVNVHAKGGSVLPLQQAAMTTTEGRKTPFNMMTFLCPESKAKGSLFWDDGDQVELNHVLSASYFAEVTSTGGTFTTSIDKDSLTVTEKSQLMNMEEITIVGKGLKAPTSATLNGKSLFSSQMSFNATSGVLLFSELGLSIDKAATLQWK